MTQTVGSTVGQAAVPVQGAGKFRDTPRLLARHRNLLTVLVVLWAAFSIAALGVTRSNMSNVRRSAAQVQLVQQTKIQLTRADSLATSGFLSGGLQSDKALAAFAQDIRDANVGLAKIQQGPHGELADASIKATSDYLADVTAAQANNRQGFPVGATYQKSASKLLSDQVLAPLQSVEDFSRVSLNSGAGGLAIHRWLVPIFVLFLAVPLILALLGLSRRSNRSVNVPVMAALLVSIVGLLLANSLTKSATNSGVSTIKDALHKRDLIGQARVALYDAKSNEALTLIARGSGQPYEYKWRQSMATVDAALRGATRDPGIEAYVKTHQDARALDDSGDWDAARAKILPAERNQLSSAEFASLDQSLESAANDINSTGNLRGNLSDSFDVGKIALAQVLLAIAAAIAAWLVRFGYAQRLKEYR